MRTMRSRKMRWEGHAECMGTKVNNKVLTRKLKGKSHMKNGGAWEDNIKLDCKEKGWEVMGCILAVYDRDL
jgi:hypothetical protein